MNGAIALPCAKTISAPKTASMKRIGKSQYFLRTRRNDQNSIKKDTLDFTNDWNPSPEAPAVFQQPQELYTSADTRGSAGTI